MNPRQAFIAAFLNQHPDDAARSLEKNPPQEAGAFLEAVPREVAARIVVCMAPAFGASALAAMQPEPVTAIFQTLTGGRAATILRFASGKTRRALLQVLPAESRERLGRLLGYPANTVGALADTAVVVLQTNRTVGEAVRLVNDGRSESSEWVYLVDPGYHLTGAVRASRLFTEEPSSSLQQHSRPDLVRLAAGTTSSTAALHPAWRDFDELPVVDRHGAFVGVVHHRTLRSVALQPATATPQSSGFLDSFLGLGEMLWLGLFELFESSSGGLARSNSPAKGEIDG